MEKNLSRFILLKLAYSQLNDLFILLYKVCDLLFLSLLFNVSLVQDLLLIYPTRRLFIYESLN